MSSMAEATAIGPYDTPQSASARFLLELVAWVTGPWAAASLTGMWWVALPVLVVLLALPAVFSTPGDKKHIIVATPGVIRICIELSLLAVALAASRVVFPKWSWYAVLALGLAFVISNYPRLRWLAGGASTD